MRTVARHYGLLYRAGVFLIILVFGLIFYKLALVGWDSPVELGAYDMLLRMRPAQAIRNDIVILAIDEKTTAELGQLPWSRAVHARILRALQKTNAKYIVYDMLFSGPETEHPGADRAFRRAMTMREDVFLPMVYDPLRESAWDASDLRRLILMERFVQDRRITYASNTPRYRYYYFIPPWPDFISAARGVGSAVVPMDISPVVRRAQIANLSIVKYPVPSEPLPTDIPLPKLTDETVVAAGLPLLVSQAVMRVGKEVTQIDFGDSITFLADLQPYVSIPIDEAGGMMINYAGPAGSYPHLSAIDLLDGKIDTSLFDDKIVFVGITDSRTALPAILRTPFGLMPRVEITANSVATILDRSYIARRHEDALAAMLILAIILGLLLPMVPGWDLAPMGLALCLTYIAVAVLILVTFHRALPVMPALILILLGSAAAALLKQGLFTAEDEIVEEG